MWIGRQRSKWTENLCQQKDGRGGGQIKQNIFVNRKNLFVNIDADKMKGKECCSTFQKTTDDPSKNVNYQQIMQ